MNDVLSETKDNTPLASGVHQEKCCQQDKGDDPALLLSLGEASPGVLCPALGSPLKEGHGAPATSPAESYEDDQGASLIRGEAERAGSDQLGED